MGGKSRPKIAAFGNDARLFYCPQKASMDSQSPSVKGWQRFKHAFNFSKPTRAAEIEAEEGQAQQPFERAAIEYGCTRMVIDFDRMDQQ